MKTLICLIFLFFSFSFSSADQLTKESKELLTNLSYRLAKSYYNIGSYQRAIRLLRKTIKETKDSQAAKQLLVDSYSDLISQIHIEYITLYVPDVMEGETKDAEKSVVDIFNRTRPEPRDWLCSRFYYSRGLLYTLFRDRARANQDFINSLAYDPTSHKSLLWLVRNIVDEFPAYSSEIIKYVKTFAGIVPGLKKDKTYQDLLLLFPGRTDFRLNDH